MKKILVTGAAGFLGSHLVEKHLLRGDEVFGVDNFISSTTDSAHHLRLLSNKNYRFDAADVSTYSFLSLFLGSKFDVIYNFACPASPPIYQNYPIETTLTCVNGMHNVLSLASKSTVVVQASTSEVYGDPSMSPQQESYRGNVNSYGPRACYDEGKRAAEALCYDHLHKRGIDARVVRIFNTYGPQMDPNDGRVITNLVTQALKNKPMTIYGDGLQTRSFCYVDDLIRGIMLMAELDKNPGHPINLGNPNEFTILKLVEKIQKKIGGYAEFKQLPVDDPLQRKPDITKAQTVLGWSPVIDLDEGLDKTIDYLRKF